MTYACPIIESYRNAPVRERTGTVEIVTINLIIQLIMHLNETSSNMRKMIAKKAREAELRKIKIKKRRIERIQAKN
jgi:hypothetical protein